MAAHSTMSLQNLITRTPGGIRKLKILELLKRCDLPMGAIVVF